MFSAVDPILYFVTPEIGDDVHQWESTIIEAVKGGVNIIQVRDKRNSSKRVISAIKRIRPLLCQAKVPLLINDRVDIAVVVQADGVHLGQSDLTVSEARSILGHEAIIGLSVETIEQAREAEQENVHYLAASPVFASKTKLDCHFHWGIDGLKQLCAISSHPIIAIGGIHKANMEQVLAHKVAGIAVVSAISSAPCPQTATKELLNKIREYQR